MLQVAAIRERRWSMGCSEIGTRRIGGLAGVPHIALRATTPI
jgi:hypothetical protein